MWGNGVEEIDISEGVTEISLLAFACCNELQKISLPGTITDIGARAFGNCEKLEEIEVSEDNTSYKSMEGVLFTKEGDKLICYPVGKKDADYEVPDGVVQIEAYAFSGAVLQTLSLPDSINYIGEGAFQYMKENTLFKVPKDSYAEQYVIENELMCEIY